MAQKGDFKINAPWALWLITGNIPEKRGSQLQSLRAYTLAII